jgi:hypothetical protein
LLNACWSVVRRSSADWYDQDGHFAASVIRSDESFVIHAYEDAAIEMFVDGQKVKRSRKISQIVVLRQESFAG